MADEYASPQDGATVIPKRPEVPQSVRDLYEKLWKETSNVPDHDSAVRAARECQKALFPALFDRSDRYRGMVPTELRTRRDDRRVRVNLAYKNVLQTVALCVPDDHSFKFDPVAPVGAEKGLSAPAVDLLAKTLVPVVKQYCEEAGFQEVVQGWVQDACQYRLAIMKIVFDRDFVGDTVRIHSEGNDQQENIERLRVLTEDFQRKIFQTDDARFEEMKALQESLGIGELKLWTGIRAELVPIDCFRFDPCIRGYEQIYNASWMSHDVQMSDDDIRAKYPFKLNEDGTWTGIHPEDINSIMRGDRTNKQAMDTFYGQSKEKGKGPLPTPDSSVEVKRLTVREIWSKKLNKVFVLVDGVPYPIASWSPVKPPRQWYPFRVLRLNRWTGQVYGYSDVELQMEIQHRINRKRSDEERGRWLSLPRGIYNTQGIDQGEVTKMRDHNPGEWRGINLGGAKSIKEVMEFQQFAFDVNSFDTSKDEMEMRMMASLPQQMMGMTGAAKYSSEVEAAMQGAAISSNARGTVIRRALEGAYEMVADILLQELEPEEALESAGAAGLWPHIYSEQEGKRLLDEIKAQAQQEASMQKQMMMAQQQMAGVVPQAPPETMDDSVIEGLVKQKCLQTFGWEEPVTRETLYRRLRCKVTVAMNTAADRAQRIDSIQKVCAAIQMAAQAAGTATQAMAPLGKACEFNPTPMLKLVKAVFNGDDEIMEMFNVVPTMMPGLPPQQGGQPNPGLPPELAGEDQQQASGIEAGPSKNTAAAPVDVQGNAV